MVDALAVVVLHPGPDSPKTQVHPQQYRLRCSSQKSSDSDSLQSDLATTDAVRRKSARDLFTQYGIARPRGWLSEEGEEDLALTQDGNGDPRRFCRICHVCSAATWAIAFCSSCGHRLCEDCVCEVPQGTASGHQAFSHHPGRTLMLECECYVESPSADTQHQHQHQHRARAAHEHRRGDRETLELEWIGARDIGSARQHIRERSSSSHKVLTRETPGAKHQRQHTQNATHEHDRNALVTTSAYERRRYAHSIKQNPFLVADRKNNSSEQQAQTDHIENSSAHSCSNPACRATHDGHIPVRHSVACVKYGSADDQSPRHDSCEIRGSPRREMGARAAARKELPGPSPMNESDQEPHRHHAASFHAPHHIAEHLLKATGGHLDHMAHISPKGQTSVSNSSRNKVEGKLAAGSTAFLKPMTPARPTTALDPSEYAQESPRPGHPKDDHRHHHDHHHEPQRASTTTGPKPTHPDNEPDDTPPPRTVNYRRSLRQVHSQHLPARIREEQSTMHRCERRDSTDGCLAGTEGAYSDGRHVGELVSEKRRHWEQVTSQHHRQDKASSLHGAESGPAMAAEETRGAGQSEEHKHHPGADHHGQQAPEPEKLAMHDVDFRAHSRDAVDAQHEKHTHSRGQHADTAPVTSGLKPDTIEVVPTYNEPAAPAPPSARLVSPTSWLRQPGKEAGTATRKLRHVDRVRAHEAAISSSSSSLLPLRERYEALSRQVQAQQRQQQQPKRPRSSAPSSPLGRLSIHEHVEDEEEGTRDGDETRIATQPRSRDADVAAMDEPAGPLSASTPSPPPLQPRRPSALPGHQSLLARRGSSLERDIGEEKGNEAREEEEEVKVEEVTGLSLVEIHRPTPRAPVAVAGHHHHDYRREGAESFYHREYYDRGGRRGGAGDSMLLHHEHKRHEEDEGDGDLGIEGVTIVMRIRGKHDLVINTDLTREFGLG